MALIDVKVPQLSESVAEATLLQWKKKPGEAVNQDEILIEIETDKVVLEVPAPASGVMAQLVKPDGATVVADEVIAKIDTEAKPQVSPSPVQAVPAAPVAATTAAAFSRALRVTISRGRMFLARMSMIISPASTQNLSRISYGAGAPAE